MDLRGNSRAYTVGFSQSNLTFTSSRQSINYYTNDTIKFTVENYARSLVDCRDKMCRVKFIFYYKKKDEMSTKY